VAKSKAQVRTLIQESARFVDGSETYLAGTFTTNLNSLSVAIAAGDDEPEDAEMEAALDAVVAAAVALRAAHRDCFRAIHKTLGRYGAAPSLDDLKGNLAAFHDKLHADTEEFESRGLSKFSSWSAGGSNVGTGTFMYYGSDPDGQALDISHVETLTLLCKGDQQDGESRGAERWQLKGATRESANYLTPKSGLDAGYDDIILGGTKGWNPDQPVVAVGSEFNSVAWGEGNGNLIAAGDFAGTGTTDEPTAGWTNESGAANLSYETTNVLKQNVAENKQSLKAVGNFKISQSLAGKAGVQARRAYGAEFYCRVDANVTAGTATLKIIDDSTTHCTVSIDTTTLTNDTWTKIPYVAFVLPTSIGNNLRAEIELASYAGSDEVLIDGVVLAPLALMDGGRAGAITEGVTDWRRNDTATGATTSADTGNLQRRMNTEFECYVRHAGTSDYWDDYA